MVVKIDGAVFNAVDSTDDKARLLRLLLVISIDKRHNLYLKDAEIFESRFFENMHEHDDMLIMMRECYVNSVQGAAHIPQCEVVKNAEGITDKPKFNVSEATRYLEAPLMILVENGLNDQYFFDAVFKFFDSSHELTTALQKNWITFENIGGCTNLKNYLDMLRRRYNFKDKFIHAYAVLDSDKHYKDEALTKEQKENVDYASRLNVKCHILEKRAMENYLPDEALPTVLIKANWIAVYKRLTPEQKDFICIASGFSKDTKKASNVATVNDLPPDMQTTYRTVSDTNFKILHGSHILGPDFKTEFPKSFESPYVNKRTMTERLNPQYGHNEYEEIINDIKNLL